MIGNFLLWFGLSRLSCPAWLLPRRRPLSNRLITVVSAEGEPCARHEEGYELLREK